MYETEVSDGVLRFARTDTRWLSSTWNGGFSPADAAYNVTVPEGFDRTDLDRYSHERRTRAGYDDDGPTLLTGVGMQHARVAELGSVTCVATAGLSNPAALPMESTATATSSADFGSAEDPDGGPVDGTSADQPTAPGDGTVNLLLGTTRALDDGAMATLLATAVEAKTATLLAHTGFPGTTTDAVVVGSDPNGDQAPFAGSGTELGQCARACVRDAVEASLESRYRDSTPPGSVEGAEYGTVTTRRAAVTDPNR